MPAFRDKAEFPRSVALAATDKALLCRFEDGAEHWIPQGQIDDDSDVWKRGDEGTLIISAWIAEQKGLV
ncbi:MAG: hypothetical protein Q8S13_12365 [Dehalococcoidia bacterium]|nr:hypothetical protein [Dehalococcoidia bacterium]